MKTKENVKKNPELAEECEGIMADLVEIQRKINGFRNNFSYNSTVGTILDGYVIPYVSGLLGEGQIMMSLKDISEYLEEHVSNDYEDELDEYSIPNEIYN
jgi:hypothetical protein